MIERDRGKVTGVQDICKDAAFYQWLSASCSWGNVQMNCLRTASGLLMSKFTTFHDVGLPSHLIGLYIWTFCFLLKSSVDSESLQDNFQTPEGPSETLTSEHWSLWSQHQTRCSPVQIISSGTADPRHQISRRELELYIYIYMKKNLERRTRRILDHCVFHRKKNCSVQYF
jgi:hypothetical protein